MRRDTAARYHAGLDPGTPNAEARLLRVYDEMLEEARDSSKPSGQQLHSDGARLAHLLRRDGIEIDPDGRTASHHFELKADASTIEVSFEGYGRVRDPEVLREHARRMQGALGRADPADAVLAAREMVESMCKLVLDDYGETPPKNANLGQLYKQAPVCSDLTPRRLRAIPTRAERRSKCSRASSVSPLEWVSCARVSAVVTGKLDRAPPASATQSSPRAARPR